MCTRQSSRWEIFAQHLLSVLCVTMQVEAKEIVSLGAVIKQLQKTYTGLKHVRLGNYQFKE